MRTLLLSTAFLLLSSCASLLQSAIKEPRISYKSIALGDISHQQIELKPTLSIFNPNGFNLPVDSVEYELIINNKKILTGKTNKLGILPATQSKDVTLSLLITQATLKAFQDILFKEDKLNYKLKGFATLMGLKVPYEHTDSIIKPQISLADIRVGQANFNKLGMNLLINIENPNSFSIPLDSLNYKISSGAKSLLTGNLKGQEIKSGKNQISLPLTIRPNDFFSNIFTLLQKPKMPIGIEINSPMFNYSGKQTLDLNRFF